MSNTKHLIELTKDEIEEIISCLRAKVLCYKYHSNPPPTEKGMKWIETYSVRIEEIVKKLRT